jgi:hypothetical protein
VTGGRPGPGTPAAALEQKSPRLFTWDGAAPAIAPDDSSGRRVRQPAFGFLFYHVQYILAPL